jgi:hypothetical protein
MSTLPRRWSTEGPDEFDSAVSLRGTADVDVTGGVESVGSGEGGNIFSNESGVGGKGGSE